MTAARRGAAWLLGGFGAALVTASLAYDPRAEAADPKRVLGLLVAAAAFALVLVRRSRGAATSWGARAGVAFVAMSALSLGWGLPQGARDLGALVGALGAGVLASQLGVRVGRHAARALAVAVGMVSGAVAIAAALHGARGLALHGGQGNPNWLGLLLACALPLCIDAARAWRGRGRAIAGIACAAAAVGLLLSHSRVGWAAAFVACAWMFFASVRGRWTRRVAAVATTVVVLLAARGAAAEGDVPADLALRGRAWIWHGAARAASASAPFGVGLGRFGHAYLDAQGQELARMTPPEAARRFVNATTAHDEYLQVAVESGPFAALLLVWTILLGVRAHARAGWIGGAASVAALGVACFGDSPLRQPAILLLAGFALGVPTMDVRAPRRHRSRHVTAALVGLAAVAWLLVPATRGWLSTRERSRAVDLAPDARLAALLRACRIDPSSGEAALELGLHELALGEADRALPDLRRADALFADTGARVAIGSALLARGDAQAATEAYRRALARDPGSFRARTGLAEALLARDAIDDAEHEASIARRLLPGDARILELIQRIRERRMP